MLELLAVAGINEDFFNLTLFLQRIVNGLTNGAIYALLALTVVMIFRTTGHLNFAQGELAMFSAFIVYVLAIEQGWGIWLALLASVLISMLTGAVIERTLIRPLERRNPLAVVIVTLGLFLILNALAGEIWTYESRPFANLFPGGLADQFVPIEGNPNVFVRYEVIGIWAALVALLLVLGYLLQRTKLGLAYRAVSSNRESSLLVGIPVNRMLLLGWALAAGIGALAGTMVGSQGDSVNPNMMAGVLLYGFAAATLGGFDSLGGAVLAGLIVGLAEALLPGLFTFIGTELGLAVALLVILVVLIVRPQGLFGTKRVERV